MSLKKKSYAAPDTVSYVSLPIAATYTNIDSRVHVGVSLLATRIAHQPFPVISLGMLICTAFPALR